VGQGREKKWRRASQAWGVKGVVLEPEKNKTHYGVEKKWTFNHGGIHIRGENFLKKQEGCTGKGQGGDSIEQSEKEPFMWLAEVQAKSG